MIVLSTDCHTNVSYVTIEKRRRETSPDGPAGTMTSPALLPPGAMTKGQELDVNADVEFAEEYLQMTCVDPATADPELLERFSRYYTEVHSPDIVRNNPGIQRAYRYQIESVDPAGEPGPRFLAIYEWQNRHAAQVFVVRGEAPTGSWRSDYLPEPRAWSDVGRGPVRWGRLMCNRLGESGPPQLAPHSIVMVGLTPPADSSASELEEFHEHFVSSFPLTGPQGVSYTRSTKYQLEHLGFQPPQGAQPKYLEVYELSSDAVEALGGLPASPIDERGPEIWQRRQIQWRLRYRRISGRIYPGARYAAELL